MTRFERGGTVAASVLALATMAASALTTTPLAAAGAPPFCVKRGGGGEGGGSPPQNCAYSDYQVCLQAAADQHGNCVQNIDYHGVVSTTPVPARPRHRR